MLKLDWFQSKIYGLQLIYDVVNWASQHAILGSSRFQFLSKRSFTFCFQFTLVDPSNQFSSKFPPDVPLWLQ